MEENAKPEQHPADCNCKDCSGHCSCRWCGHGHWHFWLRLLLSLALILIVFWLGMVFGEIKSAVFGRGHFGRQAFPMRYSGWMMHSGSGRAPYGSLSGQLPTLTPAAPITGTTTLPAK
ncbi:MAG TPA: hypothetical protein VHA30_05250 [Patescibacteria group bacterium]|nr:hypothetical protein [Patescibacteria group bacterium]